MREQVSRCAFLVGLWRRDDRGRLAGGLRLRRGSAARVQFSCRRRQGGRVYWVRKRFRFAEAGPRLASKRLPANSFVRLAFFPDRR